MSANSPPLSPMSSASSVTVSGQGEEQEKHKDAEDDNTRISNLVAELVKEEKLLKAYQEDNEKANSSATGEEVSVNSASFSSALSASSVSGQGDGQEKDKGAEDDANTRISKLVAELEKQEKLLNDAYHYDDNHGTSIMNSPPLSPTLSVTLTSSIASISMGGQGGEEQQQEKHNTEDNRITNLVAELVEQEKLLQAYHSDDYKAHNSSIKGEGPVNSVPFSPTLSAVPAVSVGGREIEQKKQKVADPIQRQAGNSKSHADLRQYSTKEDNLQDNTKIAQLVAELEKQENLLQAYHDDNQKLYSSLKSSEAEIQRKEVEWEELLNSLKTEVATLKIQRFVGSPSRPGSATTSGGNGMKQAKQELERFKEESAYKSEQLAALRKEIVLLQNNLAEVKQKVNPGKITKSAYLEKEKEWEKKIRGLNQQVRTLQKILYTKDPSNRALANINRIGQVEAGSPNNKSVDSPNKNVPNNNVKEPHILVLETRIVELERNLEQADSEGRDRLKEFQAKLNSLKAKYDEQIKELESRLEESANKLKQAESSTSSSALAELQARLEKGQTELTHQKHELSRVKRELEISQKSVLVPHNANTSKQDASTLSLAIKSFKSELAEKEKEIVKMKKEMAELNRTNVNLKREREKYLTGGSGLNLNSAMPVPRVVSRGGTGNVGVGGRVGMGMKGAGDGDIRAGLSSLRKNDNATAAAINANVELLQDTLDYERQEFEGLLAHKRKEIEEREKIIQNLRKQLFESGNLMDTNKEDELSEELRRKGILLEELRSRVTTQNELILRLKEHLSHSRGLEEKSARLERELGESTNLIQQLTQKLHLAQAMSRPENEILSVLAEKFDQLNSRYLQRENEMKTLLNKLSVRTGAPNNPTTPSASARSGYSNYNIAKHSSIIDQLCLNLDSNSSSRSSPEFDLRQLSPSLYGHLFSGHNGGSDPPQI